MEKVVMCALDYATPLRIQTSPAHSSSSTDTSSEIGSAFNSPTQGKKKRERKLLCAYDMSHNRLVVHTLLCWQNINAFGHVIRIDLTSSDADVL